MKELLVLVSLLLPTAALADDPPGAVAAEVEKGVKAYNARDLSYYEACLAPDAVYIAEDGAVMAGKERVVRLFTRIFEATPPRQLAVADVATGSKGDVAWARFKWTLSGGAKPRSGVGTTVFAKEGGDWKIVLVQNTPDGHAKPHGH